MCWKELPKWLKVESVVLAALSLLVLLLGVYQINQEKGGALFIEIFLPIVGFLIAACIVSYSIFKKSWKIFIYLGAALAIAWFIIWWITD